MKLQTSTNKENGIDNCSLKNYLAFVTYNMTACAQLLNLPFLLKVIDGAVNGTGKLVCMRGQYVQEARLILKFFHQAVLSEYTLLLLD